MSLLRKPIVIFAISFAAMLSAGVGLAQVGGSGGDQPIVAAPSLAADELDTRPIVAPIAPLRAHDVAALQGVGGVFDRGIAEGLEVIYYEEGLSGTVTAVERGNYRGLFVDGQNVSGTDLALLADSRMLAHVPLLRAAEPK